MDYNEFVKSNGIEDVVDGWIELINEEIGIQYWVERIPAFEHREMFKSCVLREIAHDQQQLGSKPVSAEYIHNKMLAFIEYTVRRIFGANSMSASEKHLIIKAYLDGYAQREYLGW